MRIETKYDDGALVMCPDGYTYKVLTVEVMSNGVENLTENYRCERQCLGGATTVFAVSQLTPIDPEPALPEFPTNDEIVEYAGKLGTAAARSPDTLDVRIQKYLLDRAAAKSVISATGGFC